MFIGPPENNNNNVSETEVTGDEIKEENDNDIIYSEKGLVDMEDIVGHDTEQSILHEMLHGEKDFREPLVEKWNYELEQIQDDLPEEYESIIDEDWWKYIELSEGDIESRNAPGWSEVPGDIYDTDFGTGIEMTITNPPMFELNEDDPNLNKFVLSVGLEEDLSSPNSKNEFLSRRHFAVQTMDVALRTILGENNYNREELYDFISDYENGKWNIGNIDINFNYEDWGYYKERFYDNYDKGIYDVGIEVDTSGDYNSFFSLHIDFELD